MIAVFESEPALADVCPPDGMTMLHRAAGQGTLLVAKWLLDHGADVNRRADCWRGGRTPLEFAVWECAAEPWGGSICEALAALLIERGAALTPLSAAALGRGTISRHVRSTRCRGKTLLQAAVRGDRPDVLRQLLEMGLDPNERMQMGQLEDQTFSSGGPLMEAVNTGRIEMARAAARARRRSERSGVHLGLADLCGIQRRFAAHARTRPGDDRLDGETRRLDRRRLGRIPAQRGDRAPHARGRARSASGVRHVLGSDGRRTDSVERREWPERGHRAHGARADRLAAGRPAMVLDAVASAARARGSERRRTGGLPRVVSADSRALRSQSSDAGDPDRRCCTK